MFLPTQSSACVSVSVECVMICTCVYFNCILPLWSVKCMQYKHVPDVLSVLTVFLCSALVYFWVHLWVSGFDIAGAHYHDKEPVNVRVSCRGSSEMSLWPTNKSLIHKHTHTHTDIINSPMHCGVTTANIVSIVLHLQAAFTMCRRTRDSPEGF